MRTAVEEAALANSLSELVTVVASVPESERVSWYRSMESFSRTQHPDGLYPLGKLAGAWLRVAGLVWPEWPTQSEGD